MPEVDVLYFILQKDFWTFIREFMAKIKDDFFSQGFILLAFFSSMLLKAYKAAWIVVRLTSTTLSKYL